MRSRIVLAAVVAAAAAFGHHSYGDYYQDRTVSIEGDIERFLWMNPHAKLIIKTKDSVIYTAEWSAINRLAHDCVTRTSLKPGDHVIVTGSPKRNPEDHTISLLKEVRRPSDGWSWPGDQTKNKSLQ